MLGQLLRSSGYEVAEAADGREAVDEFARAPPDLLIMDLGMPGMDGFSAVAEIRRQDPAARTPILILSAYDRLEFRIQAVSAGCAGFITKPMDPAVLLDTIRLLLGRDEVNVVTPPPG
jgi:DNA-binding response OmpR family regulator